MKKKKVEKVKIKETKNGVKIKGLGFNVYIKDS